MKKILIVILLIIASFILLRRLSADIFLPHLGSCIKAKITSRTMRLRYQKATYLYEFHKNEEDYENNSEIMVGSVHEDSICVLYLEEIPSVNMRYSYFKEREKQ
jgi:hypothetical protein